VFVQPAAVDQLGFAGTSLEIRWFVSTDENLLSNRYVDDVVLEVCRPSTQPDVVFHDDFATENHSQWTTNQGSGSQGVRLSSQVRAPSEVSLGQATVSEPVDIEPSTPGRDLNEVV
jgi:hypothetical protein